MFDFLYLVPELFLLFSTILVLFLKNKEIFASIGLLFTAYLVFEYQHYLDASAFNNLFFFGKITQMMKLFSLILGMFVALMFHVAKSFEVKCLPHYISPPEKSIDQSITMMMFCILGTLFVISSNNFMSLYLSIELQSLPMYVLAASNRNSLKSSEAGAKYFVLGSVASCIMVYGISILYVSTGSLAFAKIAYLIQAEQNFPIIISMIFIISALLFKLSAAPFHLWLPDVYSGSPKKVTAFFAIVPKISIVVLLFRLFDAESAYRLFSFTKSSSSIAYAALDYQSFFKDFFLSLGCLSVFLGSMAALMQNNIRRLFAYSTVSHVGYIMIAISVSKCSYAECLTSPPIMYILFYSVLNLGLFSCILLIKHENIDELSGLAKKKLLLPLCLSILLLSSASIPPFAGFIVKFYLISEVMKSGLDLYAFLILLSTGFGVYYYLRIVKVMYFDKSISEVQVEDSNLLVIFAIVVSVINTLFFLGFIPYLKFF